MPASARRWSHRAAPVLLAVAAGLLLQAAFPPTGWWLAAPVAVAGLSLAVRGRSARSAAAIGMVFGWAFFVPLLSWSGIEVGAVPWLILATSQAAFLAALAAALPAVQRLRGAVLWETCLWVADEAARSRLPFGGFGWGRLAFSQPHSWYTPLAALGGAPLVSAAVALTGVLLARALRVEFASGAPRPRPGWLGPPPWRRVATAASAVAVLVVGAALWRTVPTGAGDPHVVVAAVQGNVPRLGLDFNSQRAAVLHNHVQQTLRLARQVSDGTLPRPAFVLWPENASDIDPLRNPDARAQIDAAAAAVGVPILVGAVLQGPGQYLRNSGIVWSPTTGPGQTYVKRHPVPFAEYIPLRPIARLVSHEVDRVRHDYIAGHASGVMAMAGYRVGDVICFEVSEDSLVRDVVRGGGQMIVVQTNNATFDRSAETYQQLAMSQLRAVEYGRTVIVAATSGVSAVIGPDGRILQESGIFTAQLLVRPVAFRDGMTLAARVGAAPEWTLTAIGLLALAAAWLGSRRRRRTAGTGGETDDDGVGAARTHPGQPRTEEPVTA